MLFMFKEHPQDFFVDEQLGEMKWSDEGSVWYIRFEKEDQNTMDIVSHLCKSTWLTRRQIGVAGLKDKKAVTRQRITIDRRAVVRAGEDRIISALSEKVTVLETHRGDRMLGIGRNMGNHFRIRLRATEPVSPETRQQIEQWLHHISQRGFPNCFGQQRFGKRNLGRAMKLFEQGRSLRDDDFELKFKLQAFPSIYFNTQAIARHQAGDFLLDGDILTRRKDLRTRQVGVYNHTDQTITPFDYARTKEYHLAKDICYPDFSAKPIAYDPSRTPTGLMIGANMLLCPNLTPARQYDRDLIQQSDMLSKTETARHYHLFGIRRPLSVCLDDIQRERQEDNLLLSFSLPTGSYATILLGRLFRDIDEDTCARNKWRIETIEKR